MNRLLTASILAAALAPAASAQPYAITSFTVDGGGGELTGTTYTLRGTIGQPDAGTLAGTTYAVRGGFWFEAAGDACPADCDANGMLTLDDVDCFITAFFGSGPEADCDGNGMLTLDDVDCFVGSFLAGCP